MHETIARTLREGILGSLQDQSVETVAPHVAVARMEAAAVEAHDLLRSALPFIERHVPDILLVNPRRAGLEVVDSRAHDDSSFGLDLKAYKAMLKFQGIVNGQENADIDEVSLVLLRSRGPIKKLGDFARFTRTDLLKVPGIGNYFCEHIAGFLFHGMQGGVTTESTRPANAGA